MAEDIAAGLQISEGKVTIVDKFFGYGALATDVKSGVFPIGEVRALVILIGRADAFSREKDFLHEAMSLLEAVQQAKKGCMVFFLGPFPRGHDDPRRVRKLHALGGQLKALMFRREDVHYAELADRFTTPNGSKWLLKSETGLTAQGLHVLRKEIEEMVGQYGPPPMQDLQVTVDFD